MSPRERLLAEFERETATTRRHLERLPDSRLDWQPHPKSFTARGLASHLVECVGWAESVWASDELDFDPAAYRPYTAPSVADLLKAFDGKVAAGRRAVQQASDGSVDEPWRLKLNGRVRFERARADVFRDFTLGHLIHHRGQLTVYLRLLDVAVPGSYGPTADEQG
jgi:uncharacterized damage-inducible protein DinB